MELSDKDIQELLTILNIALYDAGAAIQQSHDMDEVKAIKEHQTTIRKWITRFSKQIGKEQSS
jgi:cob(I)alamin adenosyltransferase